MILVVARCSGVQLADQSGRALVDQRLELRDSDVRQRQVKDLVGLGLERGEVSVEEDGVQDTADDVADGGGVGEGFEDELLRDIGVGGVVAAGITGTGGRTHLVGLWSLVRELVRCREEHVGGNRRGGGEKWCGCCVCRQR